MHVGRKAVELGLITEMQLRDVVARLAADKPEDKDTRSLRSALVRFGLLTQRQLEALRDDTAAVRIPAERPCSLGATVSRRLTPFSDQDGSSIRGSTSRKTCFGIATIEMRSFSGASAGSSDG